ncbi:hypothetical protein HOU02_gp197 [Caulobacter phage CcrBL9]|uniref:Uncharacterized protein n=1 Tax=Caulobacter phage CcrBL9 TaxID=2283270 RepID=A0A385EFI2_9CAUD|nr:hypothetical protein HOU02_gp197 [Caulobacter phage CcrBL9]AXQ69528.1 hypothetical protein CcrBL9_gp504 [Caulobacter phage CcrBL9]
MSTFLQVTLVLIGVLLVIGLSWAMGHFEEFMRGQLGASELPAHDLPDEKNESGEPEFGSERP